MPVSRLRRRIRATTLHPLLTVIARRNRQARQLTAAMRELHCAACGLTLAAHVRTGNRWIGCQRNGGA